HEKYATTTERVLNATRSYIGTGEIRNQLEQFGWQILINYVIRNAYCHSKNIALYYTGIADVAYTPVYDLVTTQAYPRYAINPPGLPVGGRKTWAPGKTLERFFNTRLGIKPRRYHEMTELLCESAIEVAGQVIEASRNEPRWREVAKQMVHAWNEGITALRDPKLTTHVSSLDTMINAAGFADPKPAEDNRTVIGRSQLLAPRGGKR
ncbi:MAG: HipA domain-containing protein, partial [Pseudomonadota bacterium]